MEQVIVVHKKAPVQKGYMIEYIGRPGVLGNPYMMDGGLMDRETVVTRFREYLRYEFKRKGAIWKALNQLAERVRDGELLALQCYCAPLACHGDVIKEAIEGINRRYSERLLENAKDVEGVQADRRAAPGRDA